MPIFWLCFEQNGQNMRAHALFAFANTTIIAVQFNWASILFLNFKLIAPSIGPLL